MFFCSLQISYERVAIGSVQHIVPMLIAIFVTIFLIKYAKRLKVNLQEKLFHYLGLFIFFTVIAFHFKHIIAGTYNFKNDLPLFLCTFMGLIIPIYTYYRNYWMYEILFFWILAGTSQAIITPDIPNGFPSFNYFRYWIVHLGLVTIILYATYVFNIRPKFSSIFKSIRALLFYMVAIMIINYFLKSNYSYLNYKPESASVLDFLGDWPWYLLQGLLIVTPYFMLLYFLFKRRKPTTLQRVD